MVSKASAGRAAAWFAVGVVAATAITGVALAAGGGGSATARDAASSSASPSPGAGHPRMGMPGMGRFRGGPGGFGGLSAILGGPGQLHGESVVRDAKGTVRTVREQAGKVDENVTGSTMKVTSSDGTTWVWTIDSSTTVRRDQASAKATDIKSGDMVVVRGPVSGSGQTATTVQAYSPSEIAKLKQEQANRQQNGGPWPGGPGGKPHGQATPSPSGAAAPAVNGATA